MFQKLLHCYYHRRWAVAVAHIAIVTLLFVVYFNNRTMLQLATFLDGLPEEDGRIAEHWNVTDQYTFLQGLGM